MAQGSNHIFEKKQNKSSFKTPRKSLSSRFFLNIDTSLVDLIVYSFQTMHVINRQLQQYPLIFLTMLLQFLSRSHSCRSFFMWTSIVGSHLFEMAAMPLPCNGTVLIQGNLPRVLSVFVLKIASCLIPLFDSFLISIKLSVGLLTL